MGHEGRGGRGELVRHLRRPHQRGAVLAEESAHVAPVHGLGPAAAGQEEVRRHGEDEPVELPVELVRGDPLLLHAGGGAHELAIELLQALLAPAPAQQEEPAPVVLVRVEVVQIGLQNQPGELFLVHALGVEERAGAGHDGSQAHLGAALQQEPHGVTGHVAVGEYGYAVIAAADGEQAVRICQVNKDRIKLLVLDVIMPKKNGREVYDAIRATNPRIRALFTSGYTANIIHKQGVLEEGVNFIPKPIAPYVLLRKVREVLDKERTTEA